MATLRRERERPQAKRGKKRGRKKRGKAALYAALHFLFFGVVDFEEDFWEEQVPAKGKGRDIEKSESKAELTL
jgi:hypothetical protein